MDLILSNYAAVLVATIIGFFLVFSALLGNRLLAPFSRGGNKGTTYECGMLPIGRARTPAVHVRYYLFAILFLIFDVEVVFIFPWAVSFLAIGEFAFWSMVVFIAILAVGLAYAWKQGVLQWR